MMSCKRVYNIIDFGATENELSTVAIQDAINTCADNGGGTVLIENGTFISGTLFMKSNVSLYIASGAKLRMSGDINDFPDFHCEWNERTASFYNAKCFIYIGNCENVSIYGLGIIDCNGKAYCMENPEPKVSATDPFLYTRMIRKCDYVDSIGRMIFVMKSKNIILKDFTMTEMAGGWGIWINGCENVSALNLKISCCPDYPNSDGIHINCSKDVFVSDCSIHCGDDAVVVRANTKTLNNNDIPCENVIVKGCSLSSYCHAVRVGYNGDGLIRNCVFSDLIITNSRDGIAIDFPVIFDKIKRESVGKNATKIERVSFNNIIIDAERFAFKFLIDYSDKVDRSELASVEYVRNISFNNMKCRTKYFPLLVGREDCYFEDITFNNCRFDITEKSSASFLPRYIRNLKTDCVWNIDV